MSFLFTFSIVLRFKEPTLKKKKTERNTRNWRYFLLHLTVNMGFPSFLYVFLCILQSFNPFMTLSEWNFRQKILICTRIHWKVMPLVKFTSETLIFVFFFLWLEMESFGISPPYLTNGDPHRSLFREQSREASDLISYLRYHVSIRLVKQENVENLNQDGQQQGLNQHTFWLPILTVLPTGSMVGSVTNLTVLVSHVITDHTRALDAVNYHDWSFAEYSSVLPGEYREVKLIASLPIICSQKNAQHLGHRLPFDPSKINNKKNKRKFGSSLQHRFSLLSILSLQVGVRFT